MWDHYRRCPYDDGLKGIMMVLIVVMIHPTSRHCRRSSSPFESKFHVYSRWRQLYSLFNNIPWMGKFTHRIGFRFMRVTVRLLLEPHTAKQTQTDLGRSQLPAQSHSWKTGTTTFLVPLLVLRPATVLMILQGNLYLHQSGTMFLTSQIQAQ